MKTLLKTARENKGLKTREVSQILGIDQALISKFESGTRKPTKDQILKLASLLEIDLEELVILWLKEKILHEIKDEQYALQALKIAEEEIRFIKNNTKKTVSNTLQKLLNDIDHLKSSLCINLLENNAVNQKFDLEFTYESNHIEGNTLTLNETELVVNEGQTIAGKGMREHLEAINHQEAIAYIKNKITDNSTFNSNDLIAIHKLLLRGILPKEAGNYRNIPLTLKEKKITSVEPSKIQNEIEALLNWYKKNNLHPVVLAATVKEKLLAIHPFMNGNGKISRLLMNFTLLKHGYAIANIKAEEKKDIYYQTIKASLSDENKEDFIMFIAQTEKENLENYF